VTIKGTSLGLAAAFAALAIGTLAAQARAEDRFAVAPAGPCAVAPDRDPCAGGACSSRAARIYDRFLPGDVAGGADATSDPPPELPSFGGPGPCADPSAGCGTPGIVRPGQLASNDVGGTVTLPGTPPPTAPPPNGNGGSPTPPPPPPPAPPAVPTAPPAPPAPSPPAPPAPPTPPVVIEPPPGPALPPGVPTPTP
jgi:hypothetical protein